MREEERGHLSHSVRGAFHKLQDGYAGIRGAFTSTLPESVQHGNSAAERLGMVLSVSTEMRRNGSTEKSNTCSKDIPVNE